MTLPVVLAALLVMGCRNQNAAGTSAQNGGYEATKHGDGGFWVYSGSQAAHVARAAKGSPTETAMLKAIAAHTVAVWLTTSDSHVTATVKRVAKAATADQSTLVLVVYNIPTRDCHQYSAGGTPARNYLQWIDEIAQAIGDTRTLIVLEPDAIVLDACLDQKGKSERLNLISDAVVRLKGQSHTKVYIDSGHPQWKSAEEMADRLLRSGIQQADGFSLNSDNYFDTESNIAYGQAIRALVGKNFIIDTGRNGNGPNGHEWCNPRGRAVGQPSTLNTKRDGADAFVWIHNPGESDGSCNHGPEAGDFWVEVALEQALNGHLAAVSPTQPDAPVVASDRSTASLPVTNTADQQTQAADIAVAKTSAPTNSTVSASLNLKDASPGSYCVDLAVNNAGAEPTAAWSVVIDQGTGTLSQTWNLLVTDKTATTVTLRPIAEWNAHIAAGSTSSQQGFCVNMVGPMKAKVVSVY